MKHSTSQSSARVFVIGGGPAGIAAALAARQHGLDVTVADGCAPPIDKPCGEGLLPDGVAALQRLGVNIPSIEGLPFRGIRFVSGDLSAQAAFPSGAGLGVRRTNLHSVMVEHAERAGVRFLWRAVITGLSDDGVRMGDRTIPARWIIGADGSSSLVRRWAHLDAHRHGARRQVDQRFAFRRHYRIAPWSDHVELHWAARCQIYVTPVSADEVCLAVISRNPNLRLDEALPEFPGIAARVRGAQHGSVERGAVSVTRRLARVCNDRVALIGDASGGVDAITGEGLSLAFHQAHLLGACFARGSFAAGSLSSYESGHRALARRPAMMSKIILALEHRPHLRRRVIRVLAAEPKLFTRVLAMHVGAAPPSNLATNGIALGWKLLTAQKS